MFYDNDVVLLNDDNMHQLFEAKQNLNFLAIHYFPHHYAHLNLKN